jgi:hypothetical protein
MLVLPVTVIPNDVGLLSRPTRLPKKELHDLAGY